MEENILRGGTYIFDVRQFLAIFFNNFQIIAATCTDGFTVIVAAKF